MVSKHRSAVAFRMAAVWRTQALKWSGWVGVRTFQRAGADVAVRNLTQPSKDLAGPSLSRLPFLLAKLASSSQELYGRMAVRPDSVNLSVTLAKFHTLAYYGCSNVRQVQIHIVLSADATGQHPDLYRIIWNSQEGAMLFAQLDSFSFWKYTITSQIEWIFRLFYIS